ncbi:MFS transporter [Bordetella petrii]|uniref:MFS transporter n=1 Tax=Bordetella petrii TaxID=94624 RepID=UPI001E4C4CC6|nr:MFS transporter [Bordetella petrii]MCD0505007.1 MFS transporter [Bordetella petrii]
MTPAKPSASPAARPHSRPWLAVASGGLATFAVVTTEMLPVGLLTSIAQTVHASTGTTGLLLTVPALLAALFAPLVIVAAGGIDRRHILSILFVLLIIANLATALAPSMAWLLAARVLVGLCIGGIWAVASGLAVRLVPAKSVGLATSIIFGGVAAASVLGVPLGALIGDLAGWRMAFGSMAMLAALVLALHLWSMPPLPVGRSVSVGALLQAWSNPGLRLGLLMTLLLVAGHFMAFTFVRPWLLSVSGFHPEWMGVLLFAYGTAGIVGNFVAGLNAARRVGWTLIVIAAGLATTLLLLFATAGSAWGGALVLLLWGLAYGGVSVSVMTWTMKAAASNLEPATAWSVAIFNLAISMGSFLGGQMVDSHGLRVNALAACGLLVLALGVAVTIQRSLPRLAVPAHH